MKKTLQDLRKEIDEIDNELLRVIAKRIDIIREIGLLKKEIKIQPLDEKRWQEVVTRIRELAVKHNLPLELVEKIYEELHQEALKIEKKYE
jgi:chorismate mutase